MQKGKQLYRGKAKTVYETDDGDRYILEFRDDTSAFNGVKLEKLARKGMVNNYFNAFIMQYLTNHGVATHFEYRLTDTESVVKRLEMLPLECVVRNFASGSLSRRFGIEEGKVLFPPTFEFFLKNDELNDPMVNDSHILTLGWANADDLPQLRTLSFKVNDLLSKLFREAGLLLVDFKLEFGRYNTQLFLGDEFTPDGCRIWDSKTKERLDKDRFRQDLGEVVESYEVVAERLGITLPSTKFTV